MNQPTDQFQADISQRFRTEMPLEGGGYGRVQTRDSNYGGGVPTPLPTLPDARPPWMRLAPRVDCASSSSSPPLPPLPPTTPEDHPRIATPKKKVKK